MAVLIVDDDPVQRRLLEGMVRKFGYELVRQKAATRRRRCSPDLTAPASTA